MKTVIIEPNTVYITALEVHGKVRTFIDQTVLSKKWIDLIDHPTKKSVYFYVRITPISLKRLINEGVSNKDHHLTITETKKIVAKLSELAPELWQRSIVDGETKLPPYQSKFNKKETSDYILFPVIAGHMCRDDQFRVFTDADEKKDICESWQVGHKYNLLQQDDASLYFEPQAIIDTDWEGVLAKRPVGRPRKPADPFKRDNKATIQRRTLKNLGEQLDRIEEKLNNIST